MYLLNSVCKLRNVILLRRWIISNTGTSLFQIIVNLDKIWLCFRMPLVRLSRVAVGNPISFSTAGNSSQNLSSKSTYTILFEIRHSCGITSRERIIQEENFFPEMFVSQNENEYGKLKMRELRSPRTRFYFGPGKRSCICVFSRVPKFRYPATKIAVNITNWF